MKKHIVILIILLLSPASPVYAQSTDKITETNVSLPSGMAGTMHVRVSQEMDVAVGDPYPNYEYSVDAIKYPASPFYRMFYGGRCFYDASRNCQTPNASQYPLPNGGGDGDHIRYAYSDDGVHFTNTATPIIRPGKYEGTPPSSYDWDNRMDPTIIKWENTYYMYYQVLVYSDSQPSLCPPGPTGEKKQCDKILYATSPDLVNWTKHDHPVVTNAPSDTFFLFPKTIVLDGKIWLYFGYNSDGGKTFQGPWLIQSTNPTQFDFNQKTRQQEPVEWGQHAVLWPNDPQKRLHVQMMTNWTLKNDLFKKTVPTLSFSKDGITWAYGNDVNSGTPILFPVYFHSRDHTFCSIATEINGGLQPIPSDQNTIETFFYCATFDGANNPFSSDISAGKLVFTFTPKPGDLNGDGKVDIFDYNLLVANFNKTGPNLIGDINKDTHVDIFDYNELISNFGK